jgi:tRNA/tmRNA/rRNA uracil-C5-methylase (TrmA/RlmC/RlmD family)
VERAGSSTDDARVNLADDDVNVVTSAVERWAPEPAAVVVADPARSGLGRKAVDVIAATGAVGVVLVSCDAASLGRDAALLAAHGYAHRTSVVIDVFTHTHHVEVVSSFSR